MKKLCKKNVFEKHFGTHCKCGADSSIALCGRASQRAPVGSLKSSRRPRQVWDEQTEWVKGQAYY